MTSSHFIGLALCTAVLSAIVSLFVNIASIPNYDDSHVRCASMNGWHIHGNCYFNRELVFSDRVIE